jgi:hypothetical protein
MSRASWYRHGKPEKKPERLTDRAIAEERGVSLRTFQRHEAAYWRDFRTRRDAVMREAGFNGPWDRDGIGAWFDRHPEQREAIHAEVWESYNVKISTSAAIHRLKALIRELEVAACANPKSLLGAHGRFIGMVENHRFEQQDKPPPPPAPGFQGWHCWTGSKGRFHLAGAAKAAAP